MKNTNLSDLKDLAYQRLLESIDKDIALAKRVGRQKSKIGAVSIENARKKGISLPICYNK